jgi:hypothetical protein
MDAWDRNRISYIALLQTLEWMDEKLYSYSSEYK